MKVGAHIQYSTLDQVFIDQCITQALIFADNVVVTYFNTLFDGTPENMAVVKETREKHPGVTWLSLQPPIGDAWRFHSVARQAGFEVLRDDCDFLFFLDADEIADGHALAGFLDSEPLTHQSYKFANFVYFKTPEHRAFEIEDSVVAVKTDSLDTYSFNQNIRADRNQLCVNPVRNYAHGRNVLFHHFSWAKPKGVIAKKVATWGHKDDRDWQQVLDNWDDFDPLKHPDPVWGYTYQKVDNVFDIKL